MSEISITFAKEKTFPFYDGKWLSMHNTRAHCSQPFCMPFRSSPVTLSIMLRHYFVMLKAFIQY